MFFETLPARGSISPKQGLSITEISITMQSFGYHFYGDYHVKTENNTNLLTESVFHCYPNSCNRALTIRVENWERSSIKIDGFDFKGELVTGFTGANMNVFLINAEELTPGIYFVRVSTTGFSGIKKLVVTN